MPRRFQTSLLHSPRTHWPPSESTCLQDRSQLWHLSTPRRSSTLLYSYQSTPAPSDPTLTRTSQPRRAPCTMPRSCWGWCRTGLRCSSCMSLLQSEGTCPPDNRYKWKTSWHLRQHLRCLQHKQCTSQNPGPRRRSPHHKGSKLQHQQGTKTLLGRQCKSPILSPSTGLHCTVYTMLQLHRRRSRGCTPCSLQHQSQKKCPPSRLHKRKTLLPRLYQVHMAYMHHFQPSLQGMRCMMLRQQQRTFPHHKPCSLPHHPLQRTSLRCKLCRTQPPHQKTCLRHTQYSC